MSNAYYEGSQHIYYSDNTDTAIIKGAQNLQVNATKINFKAGTQSDFAIEDTNGWLDINCPIIVTGSGANDPTIATITGLTNMQLYTFPGTGSMKQCWSQIHVPHNYAPGTGIYFHAHVLTDTINLADMNKNYKINFDYSYASSNGVFSAVQTVSVTDFFTNPLQHKITEIAAPVLAGQLEVDGVIMVRMWRDSADAADVFPSDLHLIYIDCHMKISKFSTKYRNKATTGSFYV